MLVVMSVPVIRDTFNICVARFSSSPPVAPVRVLRSAMAVPMSPNDAGTSAATARNESFNPSNWSPVAPVPMRILSYALSNSDPILNSAIPAPTAAAPAAAPIAANATPARDPAFAMPPDGEPVRPA